MSQNHTSAGFTQRTRLATARERLLEAVGPHDRTQRVSLSGADSRAIAGPVTAPMPVPGYDRAAVDGWAVRAADTFGASARSPAVLSASEGPRSDENGSDDGSSDEVSPEGISPKEAIRVHTGSELPVGADAVVTVEETETLGREVEVFDAVTAGEHVGSSGEDVAEGETLYEPPHRLSPSDIGLLKSVGLTDVAVYDRPRVAVIPTGEELVQSDPEPGEVIETNGLTISRLIERWGGEPTYRDTVIDDEEVLAKAVERDLDHDVVVTTGGTSVGERDLVPSIVDELGDVLVHGVALKPGHPVALGVVAGTPVVMLPGYPVACIINAVQFLRPVVQRIGGLPLEPHPTRRATLTRKLTSEPGIRTFARVTLSVGEDGSTGDVGLEDDDGVTAEPTRTAGSSLLSSVALADGWVVVPESREGIDAGEEVDVELWEDQP